LLKLALVVGFVVCIVCGVDAGGGSSPSYVAWLRQGRFVLDLYVPSAESPLPTPPAGWPQPAYIAFDAPQGLPRPGQSRRLADEQAGTPTRRLPTSREELARWRSYKHLIRTGVQIFWATYERGLAAILGLTPAGKHRTTICETYPRYVIHRLWPDLQIPSKRKTPAAYVEAIWARIQRAGYACESLVRPAVD